ncbi:hypothetical protein STRDD10_00092 [Streptococcus sp. DD10]|uniref:accessory Sec system protein Asp4 n=1 Tax=Streptococcus sp. DD10 TaxID=1777878 RepID=UPI000798F698|nr:accessory secretory system protein Asp4 [Streptococcus sp. DD10]KXT77135.1 hypothetical protein STRDD10_00092 [Streptococcus sp. DD10]
MSTKKDDIFYKDIEGRMDELKRKPPKKEKKTRAERISTFFSVSLGLVILIGLLFTLFRIIG